MPSFNKFCLILALAFLPLSFATAEEGDTGPGSGKIAIGPQGGLTFPDFQVKNATFAGTFENKNGWVAGMFAEFGLWVLTVRPEINYVTKKYSVSNVADVENRYLEFPVMVKINPLSGFVVSPFLVAGPQWSHYLGSSVSTAGTTTSFRNSIDDWDLAGVAGLGVEFNISENLGLNLQGRYSLGFRDLDGTATEVKVRGFYVLGGLSIQNAF